KHNHVGNFEDTAAYESRIRKEAEHLGIWDRIIRLDHVPPSHLCQFYRLSRMAVSIPLEDGFPASIFEAMACGCPLIVSNDRRYEGVIVDGINSIIVQPRDTSMLSWAIKRILTDDDLACNLRDQGFKTVAVKGDFRAEISRLTDVYRALLNN